MGVIGDIVNEKSNNKKTAIYIRVSTEAQYEEGYSVDAQKEKLLAQCKIKDYENIDIYIDGGYSGSNLNRPEIQRLIEDANHQKLNYVLVYKLDRLSRSQKDTLYLIEDVFIPNGIDFISLNESFDTSTPFGRAMLGILSVFAQLERENIFLRTRMGMLERVKEGYWMGGGRTPFGYDYDENTGVLVKNQYSETVKKIYDLYLEGKSVANIAKLLGFKQERVVYQILTRKSNTGVIIYKGAEYQGKHEPIISLETYNKAMEMMENRSSKNIKKSKYLLSGLIICGHCEAKMRYQKWGKTNTKIVCYSKDKNKPHLVKDEHCPSLKYNAEEIEQFVLDDLFNFKFDLDKNKSTLTTDILKTLYQRQSVTSAKIKRLYNLYAESGDEILLETIKENQDDYEHITQQIQDEEYKQTLSKKANDIKKEFDNIKDVWDSLTIEKQQSLLQQIIRRITIKGENIHIDYSI